MAEKKRKNSSNDIRNFSLKEKKNRENLLNDNNIFEVFTFSKELSDVKKEEKNLSNDSIIFQIFSMKQSDAKEDREQPCQMTAALFSGFFTEMN